MPHDVKMSLGEPHDGMSRTCDAVLAHIDERYDGDLRAIVILADDEKSGFGAHGFGGPEELLPHVLENVQAVFQAHGLALRFDVQPIDGRPQ